uniref:Integrase catalytic domain-containing protein n=1 Tax=Ascaris lumbricoides TaxID=6252 RepID=A0A0M3IUX5_ASCLU
GIEKLPDGLFRISTTVGDLVSGRVGPNDAVHREHSCISAPVEAFCDNFERQPDETQLPRNPEEFWNLESIGIRDSATISDDDKAIQMFEATITRKGQRCEVGWPWKQGPWKLTNNYGLSLGRLKTLIRRLSENESLYEKYDEIIRQQESLGIIERVNEADDWRKRGRIYYIPHQPVITPSKTTTKVRIVYDASAKASKREHSLNEVILRGPVILPQLCGMLIRFRLSPIIVVADVEKAFLQVQLKEEDRDTTRFLWVKERSRMFDPRNIQVYRFTRLPFGVVASPFLLAATISWHLNQVVNDGEFKSNEDRAWLKLLVDEVRTNIYVDNVMIGANTADEAVRKYKALKQIFHEASMNLREWLSNDEEVNRRFENDDRAGGGLSKILGIGWDVHSDSLELKLNDCSRTKTEIVTKRRVLNQLASNYDPLGILSPTLLQGKLFFQRLWKEGWGWDEILDEGTTQEWNCLTEEWVKHAVVMVPRLIQADEKTPLTMHVFTDASKRAYATCVYINSQLVYAKTRLNPSKEISIPRMELMAVVIGTRVIKFIESQLHRPIARKILWCDAKCVLRWLVSRKVLPVFIANRIKEIREAVGVEFRYVKSEDNPADIATRGATPEMLENYRLWWKGPKWLIEPPDKWPQPCTIDDDDVVEDTDGEEQCQGPDNSTSRTVHLVLHAVTEDEDESFGIIQRIAARVSSWRKLKGAIGYIFRWRNLAVGRETNREKQLRVDELELAERWIIRKVQQHHFREVQEAIRKGAKHCLKDQLGIRIINGILRCVGRYEAMDLAEDTRSPILLPTKDRVVELIVEEAHQRSLHGGTQMTLCTVRNRYWILKGRMAVKRVINGCKVCKRYEGGPYALPPMPPLPEIRTKRSYPFQQTGIDYFGPIEVRDAGVVKKIWGCLWTCLITRAVHIDVVSDLTTQNFLSTFRRFLARRGTPKIIISDNAPTFSAADKVLAQTLDRHQLEEKSLLYGTERGITWQYTTSHSPWKGGAYERLIGMVKKTMRKALGRKILSVEEMRTFLCEVEAILNSRPLTYLYEERDAKIIRPVDFISPYADIQLPIRRETDNPDDEDYQLQEERNALREQFLKTIRTLDRFWSIWQSEYLLSLRETQKMLHPTSRLSEKRSPEVGEIVIIQEDDAPRGLWKMGKVIEIGKSSDDQVRSAVLKTSTCQRLERPLNKLYPLEIWTSETKHDVRQQAPEGNPPNYETVNNDLYGHEVPNDGSRKQSSSKGINERRPSDERHSGRQLEDKEYVRHSGDRNLQAEQEELSVMKIIVTKEGTMHRNNEDIRHNKRKDRSEGIRNAANGKTTTTAVFIALLGLSLVSIAGGRFACDSRGVMVRIPQPHGCPQVGEGIVKRLQVTIATREYQRAKAILCMEKIRRVCTKAILRIVLSVSDDDKEYVRHSGDRNLQAEQEELSVMKIIVTKEGTMHRNNEDIRHNKRKDRSEGIRNAANGKTTTTAVFIALLGLSLVSIAGGRFACDSRGVMVRIPQPHGCPQVGEGIVKRLQVTIATREYQRAKAILCMEKIRRVCTKAILRIVLSVSDDVTVLRAPTTKECWSLWKQHEVNGVKIHPNGENNWRSDEPTSFAFGWFGERCHETRNYEVTVGELLFHDGQTVITPLMSHEKCFLRKETCVTERGTYVWKMPKEEGCFYRSRGTHEAEIIGDHFLINSLQLAFVIKKEQKADYTICNGQWTYRSLDDEIAVSLEKNVTASEIQENRTKRDEEVLLIGDEDTGEPDEENKKLQFVYDKINHELRRKVEQNWMKICRHDDILIRTMRWISERDPKEAARQLIGRDDIEEVTKIGSALRIRCSDRSQEELLLQEQQPQSYGDI